ncbi:MAG: hypothetical protein WB689_36545 [Xanthobacteraceae bacterium]
MQALRELNDKELDAVCGGHHSSGGTGSIRNIQTNVAVVTGVSGLFNEVEINQGNFASNTTGLSL